MNKKDLFIFDVDNVLLETSRFIIDVYNDCAKPLDDRIQLEDFYTFDSGDLIPKYPEMFKSIVDDIIWNPEKLEKVVGIDDFLLRVCLGHHCIIVTRRKKLKPIKDCIVNKFPMLETIPIILVENPKTKALIYEKIYLTNKDKCANIYLFEDDQRCLPYITTKDMTIFIRKMPWNYNIFTDLSSFNPRIKYYNNYIELLTYFKRGL